MIWIATGVLAIVAHIFFVGMKAYMLYMSDEGIIPPRVEKLDEDGYIDKARKTVFSDIYNDN